MIKVSGNGLVSKSDSLDSADTQGIKTYGQFIEVSGNNVKISNTRTTSNAYGIYHLGRANVCKGGVESNTVSISVEADQATYGVYAGGTDGPGRSIKANNITIDDSRGTRTDYAYGIYVNDTQNNITGNVIDLTNSHATFDVPIRFPVNANDNIAIGNTFLNVGRGVWNLASGNIIGPNSEPGVNMAPADGQFARQFMGAV